VPCAPATTPCPRQSWVLHAQTFVAYNNHPHISNFVLMAGLDVETLLQLVLKVEKQREKKLQK